MTGSDGGKFSPEVFQLFDKYVHGLISRREFIDRAGTLAVAGMSGAALLDALNPRFAHAQQIAPDDARLKATFIEIPAPGYGKVRGYLVKPANARGRLPGVLVVHENRGLNPHIEDIARRIALENFVAFAPDALYPLGGYPGAPSTHSGQVASTDSGQAEEKARALFQQLDQTKTREDFIAAARYLQKSEDTNGNVGVVGFCYGGGMANFLATRIADLKAAVPFYGGAAPLEDAPRIKAPLMIHFAENDERINAAWPPYEEALKAAKVSYRAFIYPGTQHGFNNDTTPRYDKDAAALAWKRTIEFFNAHLRAGS